MTPDYAKLGFKCGIEIHQQVDSHKLFCPCQSVIRDDQPDFVVERRMRAVAGEMGDIDPAALHEFLRGRVLHYEAYEDTNCLVELDEEPPHPLNREALRVALEASLLLKAKPVDEVHVMRKTVIDGSNTSGFQRTMLVAVDGVLETSMGPVAVPTVCLEEDAARIISDEDGRVHYRLDRLGIPLVEIATAPDIRSPEHAREVALKIGGLLRATNVKRGLGTIRQDLNVSIAGGERIEVKGVQDLRLITKVVEGEVARQVMLLEVKSELLRRGVKRGDYSVEPVELTSMFKKTQSTVVKASLEGGGIVLGCKLKGCRGLLKGKLGPQLAQYARALAGVKGIFHGDELPGYGISPAEVDAAQKELDITGDDSYVLVIGELEQAKKALDAVLGRCEIALEHVPEETRKAKDDGSTEYMRPLPGSNRMYPETDQPFVEVGGELLKDVSAHLPELREDKAKRYEELGLGAELASQISRSKEAALFEELVEAFKDVPATLIAQTITAYPKEAEKRFKADLGKVSDEHYRQIVRLYSEGKIAKSVVAELIAKVSENPGEPIGVTAQKTGLSKLTKAELQGIIKDVMGANPGLNPGELTGKVMAETKGRADAKDVQEMLKTSKG